ISVAVGIVSAESSKPKQLVRRRLQVGLRQLPRVLGTRLQLGTLQKQWSGGGNIECYFAVAKASRLVERVRQVHPVKPLSTGPLPTESVCVIASIAADGFVNCSH